MKKIDMQIDEFMYFCQSKNLSRKTMSSYEQTLRLFSRYLEDVLKITDATKVTEKIIRDYILSLQEREKYTVVSDILTKHTNCPDNRKYLGKKVSLATVNNYTRNIKVFYSFISDQGLIKNNPVKKVKCIKVDRTPKDFINDIELTNLLKNMDNSKFHEYRDTVIIQTILDTGMRVGETLELTVEDLDIINRSIMLRPEITKSKKIGVFIFLRTYKRN